MTGGTGTRRGTGIRTPYLPEAAIRARARHGTAAIFPDLAGYGHTLHGAGQPRHGTDELDQVRLVPPVFVPRRLEKLLELGREPLYSDVGLTTTIGGLASPLPVFLCAFGSTDAAHSGLGLAVSEQAGRLGIPMVIGENVVPMHGYGRDGADRLAGLLGRILAYADAAPAGLGGVVVQQSTEDADAEVWNLVYSDPSATALLRDGRLAFELKVGQGAKPGLGGMTVLSRSAVAAVARQYAVADAFGARSPVVLRSASPGTFTPEILRQQVHLMRNNFPRARTWVKLHPGRDVRLAAEVAWQAGADAVTVDGAEGGTGWAPSVFLRDVGLPLAECLRRIGKHDADLLVSGRIWEGGRAVKCLARGASAVGLGRAALIAADEDTAEGLVRLVQCLELELRLLMSALGKYCLADLDGADLWSATDEAATEEAEEDGLS
jgi:methylamine---glutamate N-methyltransferase subunit C